jgi:hypothetical protein
MVQNPVGKQPYQTLAHLVAWWLTDVAGIEQPKRGPPRPG